MSIRPGWFCCPLILPLWSVALFSINIFQLHLNLSGGWLSAVLSALWTQASNNLENEEENQQFRKSVLGTEVEARPVFWTSTVCLGPFCVHLHTPPPPISSGNLVPNFVQQEKINTAKSLFMFSFQKSRKCSAARIYMICAS